MIKSFKEMKYNSTPHRNLLKLPIKCHICECLSRSGNPESKRYVLGRIRKERFSSDVSLHLSHYTTDLSCSKVRYPLNMLVFYVTGGKQKD